MPIAGAIFACRWSEGEMRFEGELSSRGIPFVRSRDFKAALSALGTDAATTWAIADDLSALRAARGAGLRTVCVFDEGDVAIEPQLEASCDVFVHGWHELTLPLIEDFAEVAPGERLAGTLRALVVDGSPEASSSVLVRQLAGESNYVIAADRGANALFAAGVVPDVFCGDADSVSPEVATWARQRASADILYPTEKYETDLGLAISCARHEAARRRRRLALTLTCATGGRPDHALAVIGALAAAADASPRIVEDGSECRILSPQGTASWQMADAVGETFSAIALREGTVVSERGSKWELDHRPLALLADLGISNVVATDACVVTCHAGVVAVYLIGRYSHTI